MLAVKARLLLKLGQEHECEALQQRVLSLRQASLGRDHDDTHRSAYDVYSRRRQAAAVFQDRSSLGMMGSAMCTCLEMLRACSLKADGQLGFHLSKSLQGMSEVAFSDLHELAPTALWERDTTLQLLRDGADTARRLPEASSYLWFPPEMPPPPNHAPVGIVYGPANLPPYMATKQSGAEVALQLSELAERISRTDTWPIKSVV